jgi:prepilin-type N-terminal cleavage/methylation domain-containing protein
MSRGFTLVEMLVAFVVLVTCLGVLLPLLAGAARQSVVLQDYARAVTLAESLLASAGEGGELRPGVQSGREGELEWKRTIEPEEARAPDAQWIAWRVSVEVRWSAGKGSRAVALATLRVGMRE